MNKANEDAVQREQFEAWQKSAGYNTDHSGRAWEAWQASIRNLAQHGGEAVYIEANLRIRSGWGEWRRIAPDQVADYEAAGS